jgi:AcrR family transcriptional regulator
MSNGRGSDVIKAAIRVFGRQGYSGASVQDIADALGMPKGTLYHYITSKEDMLSKIFTLAGDDMDVLIAEVSALDVPAVERLRLFVSGYAYLTTLELDRTMIYSREWRYLTGELRRAVTDRRVMLDNFLTSLIDAVQDSGHAESGLESKRAAYFIWGALSSLPDWYRRSGPESPQQIASSYSVLALKVVLRDGVTFTRAGVDDDFELDRLKALVHR